jgi:transposase-like protein
MSVIVVQIEDAMNRLADTPLRCPHCGSVDLKHWGELSRKINDVKPVYAVIQRYYCNHCHSTFRYYPTGIDQSRYSERLRRLAALIWLMDLSVRDVIEVFKELGVNLNRMTIWREGQKLVNELNHLKFLNPNLRYSIDKSGGINNRHNGKVLLVLRLRNGQKAVLGSLNTDDPDSVISWLKPILTEMNLQIITMGTREFANSIS